MGASAILVGACVTLAPGANIQVPRNENGLVDGTCAQNQFRNQAVGLAGNVALVTEGFVSIPVAGIAYYYP